MPWSPSWRPTSRATPPRPTRPVSRSSSPTPTTPATVCTRRRHRPGGGRRLGDRPPARPGAPHRVARGRPRELVCRQRRRDAWARLVARELRCLGCCTVTGRPSPATRSVFGWPTRRPAQRFSPPNDQMALGLLRAFHDRGLRVPERVGASSGSTTCPRRRLTSPRSPQCARTSSRSAGSASSRCSARCGARGRPQASPRADAARRAGEQRRAEPHGCGPSTTCLGCSHDLADPE